MKIEFSAGGIVYKKKANKLYVLVCQHSQHHGWVFPKGLIGDHVENEEKEETAIREVLEETGVQGRITKPLTLIDYWYIFENEKIKKTVYYYLMTVISEDILNHDKEMENVEWLGAKNINNRLTYLSEKKVWKEAQKIIADNE